MRIAGRADCACRVMLGGTGEGWFTSAKQSGRDFDLLGCSPRDTGELDGPTVSWSPFRFRAADSYLRDARAAFGGSALREQISSRTPIFIGGWCTPRRLPLR